MSSDSLHLGSNTRSAPRLPGAALALTLALGLFPSGTEGAAPAVVEDDDDATHPRPIEELFLTEVAYAQEAREVQLTLSAFGEKVEESRSGVIQVGIEYGLTDRWELSLDWNALVHQRPRPHRRRTGVGDVELGTKYVVSEAGDASTLVAVGFELGLPAGDPDRGLGEGTIEYAPKILLGHTWEALHGLTALAEVGPEFVQRVRGDEDEDEGEAHALVLGGGLVLPWSQFAVSLEGRWTNNRWNHHGEENRIEAGPGLHWRPTRSWQVGAGCVFGRDRKTDFVGLHFLILREF